MHKLQALYKGHPLRHVLRARTKLRRWLQLAEAEAESDRAR